MVKQPLFGQDRSPHQTSMLLSSIITLAAWIIFCIMSLVIKFKPQTPQYKEVQIVLSSTPVVEKEESSAEQAAAAAQEELAVAEPVEAPEIPNPVETPVAESKVEAPKKEAAPAPTQTKTPPKSQAQNKTPPNVEKTYTKVEEPVTYGTFLGDDIDFGTKNNSNKDVDWDNMFNNATVSNTDNSNPKTVTTNSGYSGSQGTASNTPITPVRSNDNTNDKPDNNSTLSDKDLDRIRKAVISKGTGSNGIETSLESTTSSSDSKTITMSDGTTRKIIKSSPINLSEQASKTIDFDLMTVKITFRVLTDGNVLPSSIKIDKAIFLDDIVIKEINEQIVQWILAPADSEAVAVFDLTIKRK